MLCEAGGIGVVASSTQSIPAALSAARTQWIKLEVLRFYKIGSKLWRNEKVKIYTLNIMERLLRLNHNYLLHAAVVIYSIIKSSKARSLDQGASSRL